eukprot:NODE_29591_length_442_cov_1.069841.p3 GENE.NODE_29591_length_442_cov_1.069841~~NODE_29591_length_442_cov_1.069841.p3  ORF type:complete len:70 (+),score=7.54 NODE_29591_length_442_cov_1.069841:108-317(+)
MAAGATGLAATGSRPSKPSHGLAFRQQLAQQPRAGYLHMNPGCGLVHPPAAFAEHGQICCSQQVEIMVE